MPPRVCVPFFAVTSIAWLAGMWPKCLLLDLWTENWSALNIQCDLFQGDLSYGQSIETGILHTFIIGVEARNHICFVIDMQVPVSVMRTMMGGT